MTWCDALFHASASSDFGDKLASALDGQARPLCQLVVRWSRPGVRVYEGWRTAQIASVLDECALVDGDVWLKKIERFDSSGRRVILAYAQQGGGKVAYRRRHKDKLNAQSNERVKNWRESLRPEWDAYCAAYITRFPGSRPMGFGRWLRFCRVSWLKDGPSGLTLCVDAGLRKSIQQDFMEGFDRSSSRMAGGAA